MTDNLRVDTQARRTEVIGKLGLTLKDLERSKVKELTVSQRAKLLKVRASVLTGPVVLTPGKPRSGKNFLTFFSAMMVNAEPLASNEIALFSSEFQGAGNVGVQVEFNPIKKNKTHLVEFNVTLSDPSKTYKFRVFQDPLNNFQDVSLNSSTQVITALIPPIEDFSGSYGAMIDQRNEPKENAAWMLHSVRITSVG